jgi:uncharacterized protein (TIGR02231 family)
MKKILILIWATAAAGQAALVTTTSKITEVTVYPDRARVTRAAEVEFKSGENTVEIPGLPVGMEDNSVRIQGNGLPGMKLESFEVRTVEPGKQEVDTAPFEKEIEGLRDKLQSIEDEKQELNRRRSYLENLKDRMSGLVVAVPEKEKGPAAVSVQDVKSYYELYGKESVQITARLRQLELDTRSFQRDLSKKEEALDKLEEGQPVTSKKAVVIFRAEKAGPASVKISYLMGGASWQPLYDARGEAGSAVVQLAYYANVWQSTGEAWDNVRLTLSTARPSIGARLPDFNPWIVALLPASPQQKAGKDTAAYASARPADKSNRTQNSYLEDEMLVGARRVQADAQAFPESPVSAVQTAEIQSLGTAAVFKVPAAASIPTDGRPHRSTIALQTMKGAAEYVIQPKHVAMAFLKSKVKNGGEIPLLPGEVSLFVGEDFVGKSSLNLVAPTAAFDLFLGADEGIKVTRKETKKRTEDGGLLRRKQVQVRAYEIEIRNFKATPAKITVTEALPVSQQSDLLVRTNWTSGPPEKYNKDSGQTEWTFELKPQEKRVISYEFEVETEPGVAVAGL